MASIKTVERLLLEDLFEMQGGFVLDFSNRTFEMFFRDELSLEIYSSRYDQYGSSKANRLRTFLQVDSDELVGAALKELWEYREALCSKGLAEVASEEQKIRYKQLVSKLLGEKECFQSEVVPPSIVPNETYELLMVDFGRVMNLEPQARGFEFERFLNRLMNQFGMDAGEPLKTRGDQIDGSFILDHETYILEAKWQNRKMSVSDLHTFHGKIEQRAAWTRGLFVSFSGFTEEGLDAFGRGKRLICIEGVDLFDLLDRKIPLPDVLSKKIRCAAQTGKINVRVRDLF